MANTRWRLIDATPHPCSYRPGQVAVTPMLLPPGPIGRRGFDAVLDAGLRRSGSFHYRPACPACSACEGLRVSIDAFTPTSSQRRVWRANADSVTVSITSPLNIDDYARIYEAHGSGRGLKSDDAEPMTADLFERVYLDSGVDTRIVEYRVAGELVAFSVLDLGLTGASSVYHAFDPAHARRSLGTYSVLAEIALLKDRGLRWYYLGLWVGDCQSLAYKTRFHPHERLIDGEWRACPPDESGPAGGG